MEKSSKPENPVRFHVYHFRRKIIIAELICRVIHILTEKLHRNIIFSSGNDVRICVLRFSSFISMTLK